MMTEATSDAGRGYRVIAGTLDRRRRARQSVFEGLARQEVSQRFVAALADPGLLLRPDHPLYGQHVLTELRIYERRPIQPAAAADDERDVDWVEVTAEFTEAAGVPEVRIWIGELLMRSRWWLLGAGVAIAFLLLRCAGTVNADRLASAVSAPAMANECAGTRAVCGNGTVFSR